MSMSRLQTLILCTGNSCRSQIAEGWFNALAPERVQAFSAGTHPAGYIHPMAVEVMAEVGVDLEGSTSKNLTLIIEELLDYVITVCDQAEETCLVFPGSVQRLHWLFEDPAKAIGERNQRKQVFLRLRDAMRERIEEFLLEVDENSLAGSSDGDVGD